LKFGAQEKIKIALAPVGSPSIAFASGGFHFGVGVGEVDDEFGDAGFEMLESVLVKIVPLVRRYAGFHGDDAVDDDIIWAETFFEKGKIGEPTSRDEDGKIIFVGETEDDFEEIRVCLEMAILG
jgi:hypothetical protein